MHLAKCREDYVLGWNDSGQLHVQHWTADFEMLWRYSTVNLTSTPSLSSHPPGQTCQHWSCREDPVHHDKSSKKWAVWKVVSGQHIDWCPEAHFADVVSMDIAIGFEKKVERTVWSSENMISYVSYLKCLRLESTFSASGYYGRFFRTHSEQANLNSIENPHGTWKWMKTMICNSGISVSRGHIFKQHSWSQLMVTHHRFIHMESWDSLKLAYCSAMTSNAPTVSFLRTMWEETQATKRIAFEGAGSLRHHGITSVATMPK